MDKIVESEPKHIDLSTAPWTEFVNESNDVRVFSDKYPVTPGHLLFVPKFNDSIALINAFDEAYEAGIKMVKENQCDGFNIGFNYGKSAGQTVGWPHVHLIPRRSGDMEDPTGGVRHVIPDRGNYKKW